MPDVVSVWKAGSYGSTVWFHELDCGHIATGRRRSPKRVLPCPTCDQLSMLPGDAVEPERVDRPFDPVGVVVDETAGLLESETGLRLEVASRLEVPVDCVTVVESDGYARVVVVFMPGQRRPGRRN